MAAAPAIRTPASSAAWRRFRATASSTGSSDRASRTIRTSSSFKPSPVTDDIEPTRRATPLVLEIGPRVHTNSAWMIRRLVRFAEPEKDVGAFNERPCPVHADSLHDLFGFAKSGRVSE